MRKLLASLAFAAALAIGASAHAAAVNIDLTQDSAGSSSWTLTVDLAAGQTLGAIQILTQGLNSFALNTSLPNVDAASSVYSIEPIPGSNALIVVNNATGALLGGSAGPAHLLIGSLVGGTSAPPVLIYSDVDIIGAPALDAQGADLTDVALATHPFPAPEPTSMMLMGLGLASLALVRRRA
jgi:hypothetical protein